MKNISIIGLGYVGLPLAILADKKGYNVFGIDINQSKIDIINARKSPFKDKKVAVLGLAYKANIDDCREGPSFEIIKALKENEVETVVYDPFVLDKSTVKSLDEAVKGSCAIIIATDHSIFKEITPKYLLDNGVKVIIDGRNCMQKDKFIKEGIIYKGIGR